MLKSSKKNLILRGWVDDTSIKYSSYSLSNIQDLLESEIPADRTAAALIIGKNKLRYFIPLLISKLKVEKKLYSKIAICNALSNLGKPSLKYLVPLLGEIGKNQYKNIPPKLCLKKGYPCSRDIAARTIGKIGEPALPYLEKVLRSNNRKQILEAVDCTGFIIFYLDNALEKKSILSLLHILYDESSKNKDTLLTWKIIRAFSSFKSIEMIAFLKTISASQNQLLKQEASRSIKIILKHL